VLVGTIDSGVREVAGLRQEVRRSILEHRFGEPSQQSSEQREVDRLATLSAESIPPAIGSDAAEVDRLVALADSMGSSDDNAEVGRLANLADGL
jgi:hypothetical protein